MSDLTRLVETLFTLRGYTPEPSPGGHVLRFTRGREHLAVRVREAKDPVPAILAHEVAETLPALGHAVLVCLGDVGHEARILLERGGIDVWTREKLIHEVGKAFLEAAEHRELPPLDAAPSDALVLEVAPDLPTVDPKLLDAVLVPPAPAAPVLVAAVPEETAVVETPPFPAPAAAPPPPPPPPSLWTRPAARPVAAPAPAPPPPPPPVAAPTFAPAPAPVPLPPLAIALTPTLVQAVAPAPPAAVAEGTVLAAVVDRDTALRTGVGRLLKVDKATLELVPLHAFRYDCRLDAKGAPSIPKKGLIAVDAVTGATRELPEPVFGTVSAQAEKLQALLAEVDAAPLVKQKIMELHTQKIRVKNALGRNSSIVEDRVVRPDPRSLQLDSQGLWWLPCWRMEGQNGTVRVNAATGAIEDEKLKRAFAQDAEFL